MDAGKKWEGEFSRAWQTQFPGGFLFRLADQMSGYMETSGNPCDFICFEQGKLFLVECKEHKKASIPFTAIPQYERLLKYKGIKNVYPGVLIWFSEKDIVMWVSIEEMEKMVNNGEKSIGIRMLKDKMYNILILSTIKKRVYMECDFDRLINIDEIKGEISNG